MNPAAKPASAIVGKGALPSLTWDQAKDVALAVDVDAIKGGDAPDVIRESVLIQSSLDDAEYMNRAMCE